MNKLYISQNVIHDDVAFLENIPLGSHICGFYESTEDLVEILVPFFKPGLENNEFCMWITSEPVDNGKAIQILSTHIQNLDYYIKKGQIDILPYAQWYLQDNELNPNKLFDLWVKKTEEVLAKGYKAIRICGNTTWLEKSDWLVFQDYESQVDKKIENLNMTAICTYQISKCNRNEIFDVIKNHKYTFLKSNNKCNIMDDIYRIERLNLLSSMSASIVHEIRNPITSVKDLLQVLKHKNEYKKHIDYFNIMLEEIDRASSIINEFLSLTSNSDRHFTRENLNNILAVIHPLLQADAIKNGSSVILELGDVPDVFIIPDDLRRLILNLVRNGLEAMPSGGNLTIRTYAEDQDVVLEVADEGIGISPDIAEKICSPFFTTKAAGTGLGLAICNNIAARHNATLKFNTSPMGTTFYIRFKTPAFPF